MDKRRRKKRSAPPPPNTWIAPRQFDLFNHQERKNQLSKLEELRLRVGVKRENLCLDFSKTDKMVSDGALLFMSELRRLIKHTGGQIKFEFKAPKSNKICQVLQQIGFCDLIGIKSNVEPIDDDVVSWRYAHGSKVEGSKYEDILGEYDGEIAPALQEKLFTGITEAMTNVANHAYDLKRNDGLEIDDNAKEWWMFSQEKDGHLSVVFCDLGAGIPRTLPIKHPNLWNRIIRIGKSTDGQAIDYAVRDSKSRTHETHRGHGLGQITRVIESIHGAEVAILSNKGIYSHSGGRKRIASYSNSILGTLICWKVPLLHKEIHQ